MFFSYIYWVLLSLSGLFMNINFFFFPLVFLSFFLIIRKILNIKVVEPWTMLVSMGIEGT